MTLSAKQLAALKRKEKFLKNSDNRLDRINGVHKGKSEEEIDKEVKEKHVEVSEEDVLKKQQQKTKQQQQQQQQKAPPSQDDLLKKTLSLQQQLQQDQVDMLKTYGVGGLIAVIAIIFGYLYSTSDLPLAITTPTELFTRFKADSVNWNDISNTFPILSLFPDFFSIFFLFELVYQGIFYLSTPTTDQVVVGFLKFFVQNVRNHICMLVVAMGVLSMMY